MKLLAIIVSIVWTDSKESIKLADLVAKVPLIATYCGNSHSVGNVLTLRILGQRTGVTYLPVRQTIVWGPVLPQDRGRLVRDERLLVSAGIHSRRTAMEALGVRDVDAEAARVQEER